MKKILVLLSIIYSSSSHAMLITSASDLALTNGVTETFNNLTTGNYSAGLTSSTFNILNPSNANMLKVYDSTYTSYAGVNSSSNVLYFSYNDKNINNIITPNPLKIEFSRPTTAFGFNFAQNCSSFKLALFNIAGELIEEHIVGMRLDDLQSYVGASSTEAIAYILLSESGPGGSGSIDEGFIDNLTTVSAVPLPATFSLLLSGLGVLGWARQKSKKHQ